MAPTTGRFGTFKDDELRTLWEGLAVDDGIRYVPAPDDPEGPLLQELEREMRERGMAAPKPFTFRGRPEWTYS